MRTARVFVLLQAVSPLYTRNLVAWRHERTSGHRVRAGDRQRDSVRAHAGRQSAAHRHRARRTGRARAGGAGDSRRGGRHRASAARNARQVRLRPHHRRHRPHPRRHHRRLRRQGVWRAAGDERNHRRPHPRPAGAVGGDGVAAAHGADSAGCHPHRQSHRRAPGLPRGERLGDGRIRR